MKKKLLGILLSMTMICTLSISALAAPSSGNVPVDGTIQNTDTGSPGTGTGSTFDVQIPTGVSFYVTQNTFPNVYNVDATTNVANPNQILNNNTSGITYDVCLTGFAQTNAAAATVASDLTLNLTGDLADGTIVTSTTNFAAGSFSNSTYYSAQLVNGTPWSFGFGGSVPSTYTLSTTGLFPTYSLNLDFNFH